MKRRYILAVTGGCLASLVLPWVFKALTPPPSLAQQSTTLLISVAASVQDVMEDIKPLFEEAYPGIDLSYNFGSSGALQQQIQQGAPADVFLSAGIPQMDTLDEAGLLLAGTRRNLLSNRLVLIVPRNSTLALTGFRELTDDRVERISVGEFRSVPAGQYAEQVFNSLGILDEVQPKLVFANNVRAVLAAVESGNVDAGIVYATDAAISDQVTRVATAPDNLHDPITYPVAVLKDSDSPEAARTFVDFLFSDEAETIFQEFGFSLSD